MLKRRRSKGPVKRENLNKALPRIEDEPRNPYYASYGQTDFGYPEDEMLYSERPTAKRRLSTAKKIAIGTLCTLLIALVGAGTAFAVYISNVNNQLTRGDKTEQELLDIDDALETYDSSFDKPFYMMLLGSDKREDDETMGARSDTNIVVRVDPEEDMLTMVSIPRDTKIEIEGYGTQKFNAAYAFGGAAGAIRAAEELLDIEISHYAEVNFKDLAGLVDAVGGVTVEVPETIDDYHCDDGDGNHYVIEEGTQNLSGGEALTFARSRAYTDGDFTRQSNQRALIQAIMEKVLHMPLTSIPEVVQAGAKCVTTDIGVMDVIALTQQFADMGGLTIYSAMLPSYTQSINGISFVINDEELTKRMMQIVERGGDPSGIVSTKTGEDTYFQDVDTSNVLLFSDDDEVASGSMSTNNATSSSGTASTGNGNQNGSQTGQSNTQGGSGGQTVRPQTSSSSSTTGGNNSGTGTSGTSSGTGSTNGNASANGYGSTTTNPGYGATTNGSSGNNGGARTDRS